MNQPDLDPSGLMPPERDACAIICYINKAHTPTHGNVQRTIEALIKMGHRAGEINGEGTAAGSSPTFRDSSGGRSSATPD